MASIAYSTHRIPGFSEIPGQMTALKTSQLKVNLNSSIPFFNFQRLKFHSPMHSEKSCSLTLKRSASNLLNFSPGFHRISASSGDVNGNIDEDRVSALVIGGGEREHALCYALQRSPSCDVVFCAPGNIGISTFGSATCLPDLDISDSSRILSFCRKWGVDLMVIGPEAPLVSGLVDDLVNAKISAFGPSAKVAALEGITIGSKSLNSGSYSSIMYPLSNIEQWAVTIGVWIVELSEHLYIS